MAGKIRVTKLMKKVEEKYQRPLRELIPEMLDRHNLTECAEELGVKKSTLGYWLLKLGIHTRRIAVCPEETLEVVKRP